MSKESPEDMLSRVESMASGSETWDLSRNDIAAIKHVLSLARRPTPTAPSVEVRGVDLACVTAEICDIDGDGVTFALGFEGCDTAVWVKPNESNRSPRKVGQRVTVRVTEGE